MTLDEAKKAMVKFVELKTTLRPAFVDVILKAEEVKQGHWVNIPDPEHDSLYECSCCGQLLVMLSGKTPKEEEVNYCEHCGCKMDEVADETD